MDAFQDWLKKSGGIITFVVGMVAVGAVVFQSGTIAATVRHQGGQIDNHEIRITNVEKGGSAGLEAHKGMDDERISNLKREEEDRKREISELRAAIATFQDMKTQQQRIAGQIDLIMYRLGIENPDNGWRTIPGTKPASPNGK